MKDAMARMIPHKNGLMTIPIPIDAPVWPVLQVPEQMTEQNWQDMLRVMEAVKPGLLWEASLDRLTPKENSHEGG